MLGTLQEIFGKFISPAPGDTPEAREHALQLACAVLLVEVMRSDPDMDAAERDAVASALRSRFSLPDDEVAQLVELAHSQARAANDFFAFTSRINDQCSQAQKIALVEAMWQVAYADAHLAAGEMHVISKVAGLLHVTHGEYIAAKMRAREAALPG